MKIVYNILLLSNDSSILYLCILELFFVFEKINFLIIPVKPDTISINIKRTC